MEGGNLREGEALGVAKAVSPSRARPLLATPLFGVVVGECSDRVRDSGVSRRGGCADLLGGG